MTRTPRSREARLSGRTGIHDTPADDARLSIAFCRKKRDAPAAGAVRTLRAGSVTEALAEAVTPTAAGDKAEVAHMASSRSPFSSSKECLKDRLGPVTLLQIPLHRSDPDPGASKHRRAGMHAPAVLHPARVLGRARGGPIDTQQERI